MLNGAEALLGAGGSKWLQSGLLSSQPGWSCLALQPPWPPGTPRLFILKANKIPSPFFQFLVVCDIRKAESWFSSKESYLTSFDRHWRPPCPPVLLQALGFIPLLLPLLQPCSPGAGAEKHSELCFLVSLAANVCTELLSYTCWVLPWHFHLEAI